MLGALLLAVPGGQAAPPAGPARTTVSDVVYRADGSPAAGTLLISWPAFTTADHASVAAGSLSVPIGPGGSVSVALVPNEGAEPAGTYYKVVLKLNGGDTSTEYWTVPAASPATLSAIRATVMPAGVAVQAASRAYVDTAVAGKASDAAVLHKSGDESVTGVKQFSASPLVPTPAADQAAANKAYVDGATAGLGDLYIRKAGDTLDGPLTLSGDPAAPGQAANRHYVDTQIAVVSGALAGKADLGHTQDAASIASGTLDVARLPAVPVSKGGTGQAAWTADRCVRVKSDGSGLEAAAADCNSGAADWANPGQIGAATPNSSVFTDATVKSLNKTRYASQFAGASAGAKLQAAINDLPSTGGTVYADFEGSQAIAGDIFSVVSKPVHLVLGPGTFTFPDANLTLPANFTLEFQQGAMVSVPAGRTVTSHAAVQAPPVQIIAGSGTFSMMRNERIYVEWYGAKGDARASLCNATAGSATLTACYSNFFTSADVGKVLVLLKAGNMGTNLVTTVASIVSATSITMGTPALGTVSNVVLVTGTDDGAAIQAAVAANPGRHIVFSKHAASVTWESASILPGTRGTPDYLSSRRIDVSGNGSWLEGNTSGAALYSGAVHIIWYNDTSGIHLGPSCNGCRVSNLELDGNQWYDSGHVRYMLPNSFGGPPPYGANADALLITGAAPKVSAVLTENWSRHGVNIDGASIVDGMGQPDFWDAEQVTCSANRGSCFFVRGNDSNQGQSRLMNAIGNMLWGVDERSVLGNTYYDPHTNGNHGDTIRVGSNVNVSTYARASNVVTLTTLGAHGITNGSTILVADVAPNASFNGYFTVTSVPNSTTLTYAQTGADVGTTTSATTGGVATARAITSLVRDGSGTVTITTSGAHGWSGYQWIQIAGVSTDPALNGVWQINSIPSTTTATFTMAGGAETVSSEGGVATASSTSVFAKWLAITPTSYGLAGASVSGANITFTTSIAHTFLVGAEVSVTGVTPSSFNGSYYVQSVPSNTSFVVLNRTASGSGTGGAVVASYYAADGGPYRGTSKNLWIAPYAEINQPSSQFGSQDFVIGGNADQSNTVWGAGWLSSNRVVVPQGSYTISNNQDTGLSLILRPGKTNYQQASIQFQKQDGTSRWSLDAGVTDMFQLTNGTQGTWHLSFNPLGTVAFRALNGNSMSLDADTGYVFNGAADKYVLTWNGSSGLVNFCGAAADCNSPKASVSGSGKGTFSGGVASGMETVTFSSTPTFDCSKGNTHKITLTGDVTSSTLSNCSAGQAVLMLVCQDSNGNHTFTWPGTMKGGMTIGSTANKCSAQSFVFDGSNAYAISSGVTNQ